MSATSADSLRLSRILQLLALASLLLLAIVAAHLFEPHDWSRDAKGFIKTFHAPGFAVLAIVLVSWLRHQGHGQRSYWYAAVAAMLAGLISELAQLGSARDADIGDLLRDAIGVAAGLGLAAAFDPALRARHSRAWLWLLVAATTVALVAAFWESVTSGHALWARNKALPTLATFASRWEAEIYEEADEPTARPIDRPDDWPVTTDDIVLWATSTGRWSTLLHLRPYPDWRAYRALSFVAASADGDTHELLVEVWDTPPSPDRERNRYRTTLEVTPTAERFTVGFEQIADAFTERAFDFEHVDIIILSLRDDGRGTLLLDDFRLES